MLIDLQLHSTFSDGYLTPLELIKFAHKRGIKTASLTDHNTISGLSEFRKHAKKYKIKVIPGMELYVKYKRKKMNFLWYNFDEKNEIFLKILEETKHRRLALVKKALLVLKKRGFKIDTDSLLKDFNDYIPINRLADKIIKNKFNYNLIIKGIKSKKNKKEKVILPLREEDILENLFFDKRWRKLSESYINVDRLSKIKKEVGGQIIFCHPGKYNKFARNMTEKLKDIGIIDGLEVLSPHHSIGSIMYAQFLANKLDLIASGGSDFHRFEGANFDLQCSWDWLEIDSKNLRRVNEIIG